MPQTGSPYDGCEDVEAQDVPRKDKQNPKVDQDGPKIALDGAKRAPRRPQRSVLGSLWRLLGVLLGTLRGCLGPSWVDLGAFGGLGQDLEKTSKKNSGFH